MLPGLPLDILGKQILEKSRVPFTQFPTTGILEIPLEVLEHTLIWEILLGICISQMPVLLCYLHADLLICSFQFSDTLGFLKVRISPTPKFYRLRKEWLEDLG